MYRFLRGWYARITGLFDGYFAWKEGGKSVDGHPVLKRPHRARSTYRKPRSYFPSAEGLERRELMSAVRFTSSSFSVSEGAGTAAVTVELSASSANTITVDYMTMGGTATFGSDYGFAFGTLTFVPGDTSETISVSITSDSMDEDDETVGLSLYNVTGSGATLGSPSTATLTINDDDPTPTVEFASSSSSISESGFSTSLTINLSAASGRNVTIPITLSGTATSGVDYSVSTSATINAGSTSTSLWVSILGDSMDEYDETAILTMGTPTNATLGTTTVHTLTINDDDNPPDVYFDTSSSDVNEASGGKGVKVLLSAASGKTVTVDYATASGTATSGSDFSGSGTVTFNPGDTSKFLSVTIINDTTPEAVNETFTVNLSNPSNANLSGFHPTTHTITIIDTETTGLSEYSVSGKPWDMALDGSGNIWVTLNDGNAVVNLSGGGASFTTANSKPRGIALGPDGNMWVALYDANKIAKVTSGGTVTEYALPNAGSGPHAITAGPDGNLWFTEYLGGRIGKITTSGTITEYSVGSGPMGITVGPDGNLWFAENGTNKVAKISTSGTLTQYSLPMWVTGPTDIVASSDGTLWYSANLGVRNIDTNGNQVSSGYGSSTMPPSAITMGPDGNPWYVEPSFDSLLRYIPDLSTTQFNTYMSTAASGEGGEQDVILGPDGDLWFTRPGKNQVGRLSLIPRGGYRASVTVVGDHVSVPANDPLSYQYGPKDGNLLVPHPLDWRQQSGLGMSLIFVSQAGTYTPYARLVWGGDASGALPTQMEARLRFDSMSYGSWVTFSTSGYATGDEIILDLTSMGIMGPTTLNGGSHIFEAEVKATWSGGYTLTRNTGAAFTLAPLSEQHTGLPDGWGFSEWSRLVQVDTNVIWISGTGDSHLFTSSDPPTDPTTFTSPDYDFGTLVRNSDLTYTYTAKNQVQTNFTSGGTLLSVVETHGLRTTYTHSGKALSGIQDPDGTAISMGYSGGQLATITMPGSRTVTVTYDSSERIQTLQNPDGALRTFSYTTDGKLETDLWSNRRTTFGYGSSGFALKTMTLSSDSQWTFGGTTAQVTDGLNRTTLYGTDSRGRLTTNAPPGLGTTYYNRDSHGQVTSIVDPLGRRTTYTYSYAGTDKGDLTRIDHFDGTYETFTYDSTYHQVTSHRDAYGRITNYTYSGSDLTGTQDYLNRRTTYTWSAGLLQSTQDYTGKITTFTYDSTRRLESIQDKLTNLTTFVYDSAGNNTSTVSVLGKTTTSTFDAMRRLSTLRTPTKAQVGWTYNPQGQVTAYVDENSQTSSTVYDNAGRPWATVDMLGKRTTSVRDAAGQVIAQVDQWNNRTTYAYYTSGLLWSVLDRFGNRVTYAYDMAGQQVSSTDAFNNVTTTLFDTLYRPIGTIDPFYNTTSAVLDSLGREESFIDADGNRSTVIYDSASRPHVQIDMYGNRTTTVYDSLGRVEAVIDLYGHRTTYLYDAYSRHEATVDPFLNRATTVYDAFGRVVASIDMYGKATTTVYDAEGRYAATIDPYGNRTSVVYHASNGQVEATIDMYGKRTTTVFDSYGRVVETIDKFGNRATTIYASDGQVSASIDIYGQRTTNVFDASGRVVAVQDSLGNYTTFVYDSRGRQEATLSPTGTRTTGVFDSRGRQEAMVAPTGARTTSVWDWRGRQQAMVDALGQRTSIAYDMLGRQNASQNARGYLTTTVYDSMGRAVAQVDPLGNRTTSVFDGYGRVEATVNALGHRTSAVYDSRGRYSATIDALNHRTTVEYDGYGKQEVVIDALSRRTTAVYDARGRHEATINALGYRSSVAYDSYGRQEVSIDQMGRRTTTVYDSMGRQVATVNPLGQRTTVEYDARGRQSAVVDALGKRTTTLYDNFGRQIAMQDANGNLTTLVYDAYDRQVGTINPLGLRTTSVLDLLNRTIATQDQLGSLTTVVYDAAGNQVNYVDPLGNKTTFVYDALNRQTEHIDALGKKATFAYDAISRMTSTTDRLARRRDFGYDAVNQKTTEGWINSGGSTANLLTFSYDAVGNQLTAGDYDGFYTFTYDALNRVHTVKNPTGQTLTMGYDVVGRRINMEDSFGSTVQSVFDDAGQLLRQDLAGPTNLRVDLTYTDRHQLATIQRYSDLTGATAVARTSFTYDDKGRLTDLHHRKTSDSSTISNYTYTFDAKDRLLTESLNGTVKTYVYDNTDQVTADGTNTFTYDANGNRTNTGYSTGAGNRLLSDGTWNFTYDDEGNQTKKVRISDGRTWTYAFDHLNQLTVAEERATDGGTLLQKVEIKYDVKGLRQEKKVDNNGDGTFDSTQKYAYDGWNTQKGSPVGLENYDVWADLDGTGSLTTRYLRGDVVDQVFARVDGDDPYWYLTDHLDSTRDVIDNTAVVKDSIAYDAFGNILSETNSAFRGRYTHGGREWDAELQMRFHRARYYDPATARWISRDPLGFEAGDGNLYRYAHNQPTVARDPSGLVEPEFWRAVRSGMSIHDEVATEVYGKVTLSQLMYGHVRDVEEGVLNSGHDRDVYRVFDRILKRKSGEITFVDVLALEQLHGRLPTLKAKFSLMDFSRMKDQACAQCHGSADGTYQNLTGFGPRVTSLDDVKNPAQRRMLEVTISGAPVKASDAFRVFKEAFQTTGVSIGAGVDDVVTQIRDDPLSLITGPVKFVYQLVTDPEQTLQQMGEALGKDPTRFFSQMVSGGVITKKLGGVAKKTAKGVHELVRASARGEVLFSGVPVPGGVPGPRRTAPRHTPWVEDRGFFHSMNPSRTPIAPRTFTSRDPLVANIANAIEARYPGHVVSVNARAGGLELDIVTRNAIIEVKAGGAGLTRQVTARLTGPANPNNLPVIGHSPQLGRHATVGINNAGGIASSDLATLLDVVRP